jgi:hypothetical protein
MVKPASRLERPEHRLGGRHAQIARQGQLEPGRQRPAIDRADHRLVNPVQSAGQPTEPQVHDLPDPARTRLDIVRRNVRPQISTRAKRITRAREDGNVELVIVAEVHPDATQGGVHLGIDRVLDLRPIQRHERDPVSLVVQNRLGHLRPFL